MRPGTGGASLWSLARSAKPDYPMKNVIIRILIYLTINLKFMKMKLDKKKFWTIIVNIGVAICTGLASIYGVSIMV